MMKRGQHQRTASRLMLALAAFGLSLASVGARAQTQSTKFSDQELRKQLDRLMFPEQYLLDVTILPLPAQASAVKTINRALPGLPFFGGQGNESNPGLPLGPTENNGLTDVLMVIDQGVSDERARLAEEVVRRYGEATGLKEKMRVQVRRDAILKVQPPELAPLAERAAPAEPLVDKKTGEPVTPPQNNIYDFIENKRDLATRTLIVIWSALASLVAVFALLSRRSKNTKDDQGNGLFGGMGKGAGENAAAAASNSKKALTKDEIYSQDAALHKLAEEIVKESAKQPDKVAGVLGRWIGDSLENAKYANLFLRNCDIPTIEAICKHLHPSDIDKLVDQQIDDFDPFSPENKKVLELMRTELARLAAKHVFNQKPEPLSFLKTVSDKDLATILADEDLRSIAMVTTQMPMHRLQVFFDQQTEERLQLMMTEIISLSAVRIEDLDGIAKRLEVRMIEVDQVIVGDGAVEEAARQVIVATRDPSRQIRLASTLQRKRQDVYKKIRADMLLVSDLKHFSTRPAKVIYQSIDGEQLGAAVAGLGLAHADWVATMPEAFGASFMQASKREQEPKEQEAAWQRIQRVMVDLIGSGLVTRAEVNQAKIATDAWLPAMLPANEPRTETAEKNEKDGPSVEDEDFSGAA